MQKFSISQWSNIFLEACTVGDEILYVMNRKKQQPRMGTFLDDPSLLMRRQVVRDTVTNEEHLA
jgi:hypothetical protein